MNIIETRNFDCELRVTSNHRNLSGYAAVFNSLSEDLGGFCEKIRPGAFTRSLRDIDKHPVSFLWAHNPEKPLASTKNGTLTLSQDSRGLKFVAHPPPTTWSKDARESVKSGLVTQCSFGFRVRDDKWTNGGTRRELTDLQLIEISAVVNPAYTQTEIQARNARQNRRKSMIDKRQEAINHILEVDELRHDSSRVDDIEFHKAEYDRLADQLPGLPTYRDDGIKGVAEYFSKSTHSVISKPNPGAEFKDGARITGGTDRAGLKPWKSNGEFLRSVALASNPGNQPDARLYRAVSGMSEGIPSDGGFLVQQDFANELLKQAWGSGQVGKLCKKIQISGNSNSVVWPGIDETARTDGNRQGGVRAYWLEEAGEKTKSKPAFRKIELNLNKLIGLCYSSDELLSDAVLLERFIRDAFASEIGFKTDDAIINGNGTGMPLGILNGGSLITQDKVVGQAASTIVAENIFAMWSRLFASSRADAVWLINQNIEPQLHTMSIAAGTGGIPVYMPAGGMSGLPHSTLFGRPVLAIEQCQTLGTEGDIFLADFKNGYILAEKNGTEFQKSIHVRFIFDESVFRFVTRIDGCPVLASPITPYKGGASYTQSHFVSLQTRS